MAAYKSLRCTLEDGNVGIITLSRPNVGNAQNEEMWEELPKALDTLQAQGARAIVLQGEGRHFCTGIDLSCLGGELLQGDNPPCQGRARLNFISYLKPLQDAMTACERANCPIIAAIHGVCYGAGIDLVTAADIRFCTSDARFSVKEVDLGLAADMGSLARLPYIVGTGVAMDLALTAREFNGEEALKMHLVTKIFASKAELQQGALHVAKSLAAKSPLALVGTKKMLLYQRGKTVKEGLDAVSVWNAAMLPGSQDIAEIFSAKTEGRAPRFSKL